MSSTPPRLTPTRAHISGKTADSEGIIAPHEHERVTVRRKPPKESATDDENKSLFCLQPALHHALRLQRLGAGGRVALGEAHARLQPDGGGRADLPPLVRGPPRRPAKQTRRRAEGRGG